MKYNSSNEYPPQLELLLNRRCRGRDCPSENWNGHVEVYFPLLMGFYRSLWSTLALCPVHHAKPALLNSFAPVCSTL